MLGKRTISMSGINASAGEIPPPLGPQNRMIGGGGVETVITRPRGYNKGSIATMPTGFSMSGGSGDSATIETADFLTTCGLCNRHLPPGRDIYMYRGDAAFCSPECREQQIKQDEKKERRSMEVSRKAESHHHHSKVAAATACVGHLRR
ncbi:Hypothetical predicted protein [Olea europaea subsp. europaea]|uniref:FLZ-type domain-containing protein n=1 Tax=Olea europaea subsp. europaea TaxID=158383 RepID=A0A8S0UDL6_OLEEU|nr:Hypothetical predicted protein [Olea europaea subsp. europaea]